MESLSGHVLVVHDAADCCAAAAELLIVRD